MTLQAASRVCRGNVRFGFNSPEPEDAFAVIL